MNHELKNFVSDLIHQVQEKYNQTLTASEDESSEDKCFRLGSNIAYYDVLDIIESQLKTLGFDTSTLGDITPILGEKIKK